MWAAGNPDGSLGSAEGEPFLVGYTVKLNDGTTEYEVMTRNGEAVPFMSSSGDPMIVEPFDPYWPTLAPESSQQEDAVTAAATVAPAAATAGGVASYAFAFPPDEHRAYPSVEVFAAKAEASGDFASGGTMLP